MSLAAAAVTPWIHAVQLSRRQKITRMALSRSQTSTKAADVTIFLLYNKRRVVHILSRRAWRYPT